MHKNEIEIKVADIFIERFSMNFLGNPVMQEMKILGKAGIPARELLHVYFDVKDVFNISIPEDDIVEGRFDTFAHIVDIIYEQMPSHDV